MRGMNEVVEKVLGQSNAELVKYLDSIHARLEKLNDQADEVIMLLKKLDSIESDDTDCGCDCDETEQGDESGENGATLPTPNPQPPAP